MTINDIDTNIAIINDALKWAEKYRPNSFQFRELKERRRKLKRIRYAMLENCSAAAYGESQVGKSYLMSSLLSTSTTQFQVSDGKGGLYSFVDKLNPSGGNTSKEESTGVITRFTTRCTNEKMRTYVHIRTLSIVDIILMLADTYYKDVKIESVLDKDVINEHVETILKMDVDPKYVQHYIEEDDVYDINDYLKSIGSGLTSNVVNSIFCLRISSVITHIKVESWGKVFSLLWNRNEVMTDLFNSIIAEYGKLQFRDELWVPFDAVLRENGTLLKVNWLDAVCGDFSTVKDSVLTTDVFDGNGEIVQSDYSKAFLSALISELTFLVPEEVIQEKPFLKNMDLLDFPGARRRESVHEPNIEKELRNMLRRGKVAYLFNKYSHALRINSVLFCQHADMSGQSEIGEFLNDWIKSNIGATPQERSDYIRSTAKTSPFFVISTKFNIDLKWTNETPESPLADRWKTRFDQTLSKEIIKPQTYEWFDNWVDISPDFRASSFQNIFLLRDFFWSRDQSIFRGFDENRSPELEEIRPDHYPNYREDLKRSFVNFPFVRSHFADPEKSWNDAATLNNDGSKAIIDKLNLLAPVIDQARRSKYQQEMNEIMRYVGSRLKEYFVPDGDEEKRKLTRKNIGGIRLSIDTIFGQKPELLGRVLDQLMIPSIVLRKAAYDVVVRQIFKPIDRGQVNVFRTNAGISPSDSRDVCIQKLCDYFLCEEDELADILSDKEINIDDVLSGEDDLLTTVSAVLAKRIHDIWIDHVHQVFQNFEDVISHADQIVNMYEVLYDRLGFRQTIESIIDQYQLDYSKELLPTVIADAVSLVLNNYITNVGSDRMTESQKRMIVDTSNMLHVRFEEHETNHEPSSHNLIETLRAFDASSQLVGKAGLTQEEIETLRMLPWWGNYNEWKLNLIKGQLLVSDVTFCNQEENDSLKSILNKMKLA